MRSATSSPSCSTRSTAHLDIPKRARHKLADRFHPLTAGWKARVGKVVDEVLAHQLVDYREVVRILELVLEPAHDIRVTHVIAPIIVQRFS
jgi:hypothetical protein